MWPDPQETIVHFSTGNIKTMGAHESSDFITTSNQSFCEQKTGNPQKCIKILARFLV